MAEDLDIQLVISAQNKAKAIIDDLTRSLGGMGKGFSVAGAAGAAAGAAIATTAAGAAAVGAGLALITASGIKSAMTLEQNKVAFTTMLGSAEKASEVLKDITTFAATTPFELPEVQNSARSLLAFGIEAEKLEPTLRSIGDVASGVGAPIGELSQLYGKAHTQGRLFAEDINQLTGRGIPIIQELADQFGVTTDKVKELVENGDVGFEELEKAFQSMSGEGGQFYNLMEEQSKTAGGAISNLKDSFTQLAMAIVGVDTEGNITEGGIFDRFKGILNTVLTFLNQNRDAIVNMANVLGNQLGKALGFVVEVLGYVYNKIQEGIKQWKNYEGIIGGVRTVIEFIIGVIGFLISTWQRHDEIIENTKNKMQEAIESAVNFVKEKFNSLLETMQNFWNNWGTYIQVGIGIITGLYLPQIAVMAAQTTVQLAKMSLAWVVNTAKTVAQVTIQTAVAIPSLIAKYALLSVQTVATTAKMVAQWAILGAKSLLHAAKVASAWVIAFGPVGWVTAAIIAAVILIVKNWDTVKAAARAMADFLRGAWENIKAGFSAAFSAISTFFKNFIAGIGNGIKTVIFKIQNFKQSVQDKINELITAAAKWGRDMMQKLGDGITQGITNVKQYFQDLKDDIMEKLGGLRDSASEWGRHLIENFKQGVLDAVPGLNAAVDGAKRVLDRLKFSRNKEIPSEIWGEHMMDNFAEGMGKGSEEVQARIDEIQNTLDTWARERLGSTAKESTARKQEIFDLKKEQKDLKEQLKMIDGSYDGYLKKIEEVEKKTKKSWEEFDKSSKAARKEYTKTITEINEKNNELQNSFKESFSSAVLDVRDGIEKMKSELNNSNLSFDQKIAVELVNTEDVIKETKQKIADEMSAENPDDKKVLDLQSSLAEQESFLIKHADVVSRLDAMMAEERRVRSLDEIELLLEQKAKEGGILQAQIDQEQIMLDTHAQKIAEYNGAILEMRRIRGLDEIALLVENFEVEKSALQLQEDEALEAKKEALTKARNTYKKHLKGLVGDTKKAVKEMTAEFGRIPNTMAGAIEALSNRLISAGNKIGGKTVNNNKTDNSKKFDITINAEKGDGQKDLLKRLNLMLKTL